MYQDEVDRTYTIVVHGTRMPGQKSSWWKRNPEDQFPFCEKLSEQLAAQGISTPVWQHCDDLGMEEFEWSGANDHSARLEAGRQLATYLNTIQSRVRDQSGNLPVFHLIGHSHGGNVILASLGYLDQPMHISSLHTLGTPFMLYDDKTLSQGRRNIYLTAVPRNTFVNVWTTRRCGSPDTADEPMLLFQYLQDTKYLQREMKQFLRSLIGSPTWKRFPRHDVRHAQTLLTPAAQVHGIVDYQVYEFQRRDPPRRMIIQAYLSQLLGNLMWPFRWSLVTTSAPFIARWMAKRLFAIATGLNPTLYKPHRVTFSEGHGFDTTRGWQTSEVLLESPPAPYSPPDQLATDDDSPVPVGLIEEVKRRVEDIAQQNELFHAVYYQDDEVIWQIAYRAHRELSAWYNHLL